MPRQEVCAESRARDAGRGRATHRPAASAACATQEIGPEGVLIRTHRAESPAGLRRWAATPYDDAGHPPATRRGRRATTRGDPPMTTETDPSGAHPPAPASD